MWRSKFNVKILHVNKENHVSCIQFMCRKMCISLVGIFILGQSWMTWSYLFVTIFSLHVKRQDVCPSYERDRASSAALPEGFPHSFPVKRVFWVIFPPLNQIKSMSHVTLFICSTCIISHLKGQMSHVMLIICNFNDLFWTGCCVSVHPVRGILHLWHLESRV